MKRILILSFIFLGGCDCKEPPKIPCKVTDVSYTPPGSWGTPAQWSFICEEPDGKMEHGSSTELVKVNMTAYVTYYPSDFKTVKIE